MKAAEEGRLPIIIQVYSRLLNEEVDYYIYSAIVVAVRKLTVSICINLDHGATELEVQKPLRWGATGIMYNGSVHSFDKNVENTKHILGICECIYVSAKSAIGHVVSLNDVMDDFTYPAEEAENS